MQELDQINCKWIIIKQIFNRSIFMQDKFWVFDLDQLF